MKKVFLVAAALIFVSALFAQTDSLKNQPKKKKQFDLSNRANDHFMIQLGYAGWNNKPDTINTKGLPRSLNIYFMLDFPIKSDPHFSVGIGAGIGSDNIYFDKMYLGIKDPTASITIQDVSDTTHFKKYKLSTAYLEAPLELRYSFNPENPAKSWKVAVGVKIGTLLNAHTKGKTWQNSLNQTLISYIQKESSKRFFNTTRVVPTIRFGYGHFSLYGAYQVSTLFKAGLGPDVRPFSAGITISGL
ncbi:MAG: outer membrane beta-barrel protein [Chitinophagaceae bacterium]